MSEREGVEYVGGTLAFAGMAYPPDRSPPTPALLHEQDPEPTAHCVVPFEPTMRQLITVLAAGIAATRTTTDDQ